MPGRDRYLDGLLGESNPCFSLESVNIARLPAPKFRRRAVLNEVERLGIPRVASGWSGCRMGFAPTGKRRLGTARARNGHWVSRSGRDRHFASRIHHGAHSTGEWPIFHGASGRAFNERGESGIRNILKPAISGNRSAASADTKVRTAAGTSPLISRSIAFV